MRFLWLPLILLLWPLQAGTSVPVVSAQAVRVIDGDTLDLDGQRIRLQGIDAPEARETCLDAQGRSWACGEFATQLLRDLVTGHDITCTDLGERTHGRIVARCEIGGQDLAALMISRGGARACPRFAQTHPHSQGYETLEAEAIARGVGILTTPPPRAGFCEPRVVQAQARATAIDAPAGCVIKGNISRNGRIYHMPGQRNYNQTVIDTRSGERWFCTEAEAQAAGWRRARQ